MIRILATTTLLTLAWVATAQMSASEAKVWKQRIRNLTPAQYKTLIDENKSLKGQVRSLQEELANSGGTNAGDSQELAALNQKVADLQSTNDSYQQEIVSLRQQVDDLQRQLEESASSQDMGAAEPLVSITEKTFGEERIGRYCQYLREFSEGNTSRRLLIQDLWETPNNMVQNDLVVDGDQIELQTYLTTLPLLKIAISFDSPLIKEEYLYTSPNHRMIIYKIGKRVNGRATDEYLVFNSKTKKLVNAFETLPGTIEANLVLISD